MSPRSEDTVSRAERDDSAHDARRSQILLWLAVAWFVGVNAFFYARFVPERIPELRDLVARLLGAAG